MEKDDAGDIVITPEPVRLNVTAYAPTILVSTSLWNNWSRVAIEHEHEAWKHRADWNEGRIRNIAPEFQASLIAVTAVAFTLDALHGALAPILGRQSRPRNRWQYIRDTFRLACNPSSRKWQNEIAWVLRDARTKAVHHGPKQHQPIFHSGLKTSIAEENHFFSAESTTRAVDLMMDMFGALLAPDREQARAIKGWSASTAHVLPELTALRGSKPS